MNIEIHVHAHFHGPAPESFTYRVDAASLRADILPAGYTPPPPTPETPAVESEQPAGNESSDCEPPVGKPKSSGAIRQQRYRDRLKARNAGVTQTVTQASQNITPGVTQSVTRNAVTKERERGLNNNINSIKNNSLSLTIEPSTCEIKPHNASVTPTVTRNAHTSPRTIARRAAPAKEPPVTGQGFFDFDSEPLPDILQRDEGFVFLWEKYKYERPVWKSDISYAMHRAVVDQLTVTATRGGIAKARKMLAYGIDQERFMTLKTVPEGWRIPDSLRPPAERGPVTAATLPPIKDDPAQKPADPLALAEFHLGLLAKGIDPDTCRRIPLEAARHRKEDILKTLAVAAKEKQDVAES